MEVACGHIDGKGIAGDVRHGFRGGAVANLGADNDAKFDFVVRYDAGRDFDGAIVGDVRSGGLQEEEGLGGDGVVELLRVGCIVTADPIRSK